MIYGAQSIISVVDLSSSADEESQVFKFPCVSYITSNGPDLEAGPWLCPMTYTTMRQSFHRICLDPNSLYPTFETQEFPSLSHFNMFIHLYFEHFSPILPIIHDKLVDINSCWPLALAMAAIGCQYTQTQEFADCVVPLQEFLRRVLAIELEKRDMRDLDVALLQALLLNQVSMVYYGSKEHLQLAKSRRSTLVELVERFELLKPTGTSRSFGEILHPHSGAERNRWEQWVASETKRRLGYAIWVGFSQQDDGPTADIED